MKLFRITALSCLFLCTCLSVAQSNKKNILLLCIDDLRPELNCFGASYIKSPNIDALAKKGLIFKNHYVNAPSCGPSRYTLLTGIYGPPQNDAIFLRAKALKNKNNSVNLSMPEWFRKNGYTTVSIGKVSHHPGGEGGVDWNDPNVIEMPNAWDKHLMPVAEWLHPRGAMHGLANGEIRKNSKDMDVFQSTEGSDMIYPDGYIAKEALHQLEQLTADTTKPFFLAVGMIKPHLPFGAPKKYLDLYKGVQLPPIPSPEKPIGISTWHKSGEFRRYNLWDKDPNVDKQFADEVRRHYAACVSYADAQVGKILKKLKKTGADKNTIVVLWGDHGWNLGDHAIWGKHNLFEEGLRSPLIISYPGIKTKGKSTRAVVETVDLFPTFCELTNVEIPNFTNGTSLLPLLKNEKKQGHVAFAYRGGAHTLRTQRYRFTLHDKKGAELYDHEKDPFETTNISDINLDKVAELTLLLKEKIQAKAKSTF
ncbi:sulfatase [Flavicella sediminum]|uniref:sulfatase n=1 Tax=Flavicella sediminum TaxID=2585141 RepID=UPI00112047E8|nr:sulfatase [Flavicella sediminum]